MTHQTGKKDIINKTENSDLSAYVILALTYILPQTAEAQTVRYIKKIISLVCNKTVIAKLFCVVFLQRFQNDLRPALFYFSQCIQLRAFHICSHTVNGKFKMRRKTSRKKFIKKCKDIFKWIGQMLLQNPE